MSHEKEKHFLAVEDDPDDAFLIQRGFRGVPYCSVHVCRNSAEARAYLSGAGVYADRLNSPLPDGILTDLRLGEEYAFDLIRWIVATEQLKQIPIFVLTSVPHPEDVEAALSMGVKEVINKPLGLEPLQKLFERLAKELCGS